MERMDSNGVSSESELSVTPGEKIFLSEGCKQMIRGDSRRRGRKPKKSHESRVALI
jgi:hypothetical protein